MHIFLAQIHVGAENVKKEAWSFVLTFDRREKGLASCVFLGRRYVVFLFLVYFPQIISVINLSRLEMDSEEAANDAKSKMTRDEYFAALEKWLQDAYMWQCMNAWFPYMLMNQQVSQQQQRNSAGAPAQPGMPFPWPAGVQAFMNHNGMQGNVPNQHLNIIGKNLQSKKLYQIFFYLHF